MNDPVVSPNRLLFRVSRLLGQVCVASAAVVPFCFLTQVGNTFAAVVSAVLVLVAPLTIGGTGALTMASRRSPTQPFEKALAWELAGLIGLALAWLTMLWQTCFLPIDPLRFALYSAPLALAWLAKLGCWLLIALNKGTGASRQQETESQSNPSLGANPLFQQAGNRVPRHRWLDAIALTLSLLAWAAWLAQVVDIPNHSRADDVGTVKMILLLDALPPGIVGGGLLLAAAVARKRQRVWDAKLLGFGGISALFLTVLLTSGVGELLVSKQAIWNDERAHLHFAAQTHLLLGAKIISALVIGCIRWLADKVFLPMPSTLPPAAGSVESRPVGRVPDLLSFLAVLLTWFCVVPVPAGVGVPLIIPGPSMFVSGFPVGLVGVAALLAAGLLRAGRDRRHLVPLELFGVLALTMVFVAAALPVARSIGGLRDPWITWLTLLSWFLFGLAMVTKLAFMAAGMIRRRERMQISLLGMLGFVAGCGALAMYWRVWQP